MKIECWHSRRWSERVSKGRELGPRHARRLFTHLTTCAPCRRRYDALMLLARKREGRALFEASDKELSWLTPQIIARSGVVVSTHLPRLSWVHPIFRWGALASAVSLLFFMVWSQRVHDPVSSAPSVLQARGDDGPLGIRVFCERPQSEGGDIVDLSDLSDRDASVSASCPVGGMLHFAALLPSDGRLKAMEWRHGGWVAMHDDMDEVKQSHLQALPLDRELAASDVGELRFAFRLEHAGHRWSVMRSVRVTPSTGLRNSAESRNSTDSQRAGRVDD